MKMYIFLAFLLVSGAGFTGGFLLREGKSIPKSVQLEDKGLQEHGLAIIGPGEASFNDMSAALRENTSGTPFEAIQPYSIFIKNTGSRAVVAFVLKWELMGPDGVVTTESNQYVTKYSLTGDGPPGSDGHIIHPNTAWLAFPGFAIAQDKLGSQVGDSEFETFLNRASSMLAQYTNVKVSLDGAFFEDGRFVGPDTTSFFSKVKALVTANLDLRHEIEAEIKSGRSADEVFAHVVKEANKPKVRMGRSSTTEDYYNHFKRSAAEELLSMRSVSGNAKTLEHALRPSKRPLPQLRKE